MDKARLLSLVKAAWLLAVAAGGIYYLAKNFTLARGYLQTLEATRLALAFALILAMRILHPHLVQRSLALVDRQLDFSQVFSIVSISQLGKYIPGGVWQFVARFSAYRQNQLTYKDMGKAFILENIWLVLGSFFVGVSFVLLGQPAFLLRPSGPFPSPAALRIFAYLSLLLWAATLFASEYGLKSARRKPSAPAALAQLFSQTSMWIFLGLSFACLLPHLQTGDTFWLVSGAFILSFLAGYVAIFAPGGIGVREYVAVLLLSALFSPAEIGIVAIVHRLLYTLAEFLLAGIAWLLPRFLPPGENL